MNEARHTTESKTGPMVSVLIPTFNRPRYLAEALASVVRQRYRNLQVIVVNDGGQDVTDVVQSCADPRIVFLNRKDNRGKASSLNEALACAKGKYIAYLDDDDLYYPNHIQILVDALEHQTDCQVAYTDLYKTYCRVMPDGGRQVLGKVVEISRDFDRFLMLYFNHVLHVSLMHRRELVEKTGLYNEQLNALIDWDINRRSTFFSDFYHVPTITGEFYSPVGESDRISIQRRKNEREFVGNILTIRTTRPGKPWPKVKDLSIILLADKLDKQAGQTIGLTWRHTFYPYKLYVLSSQADLGRLNTDMPNIELIALQHVPSRTQIVDAALDKCEGEYVALVPSGFAVEEMWVENPLYALINSTNRGQAFELEGSTDSLWGFVARKEDLQRARDNFTHLPVRQSLSAAGIEVTRPAAEELPFQFDDLLRQAQFAEKDGDYRQAAQMFEYIAEHYQNALWMSTLAAKAFYKAGDHARASQLSKQVNQQRPTVDTLLLEAKVARERKDIHSAIDLLQKAEQTLAGQTDYWISSETGKCPA